MCIPAALVAAVVMIMGGLMFGISPLRLGEFVWVNVGLCLVLAIALSWDLPREEELRDNEAYKIGHGLLTEPVVRQVIGQTTWQLFVVVMMLLTGHLYLPETADGIDSVIGDNWAAKYSSSMK